MSPKGHFHSVQVSQSNRDSVQNGLNFSLFEEQREREKMCSERISGCSRRSRPSEFVGLFYQSYRYILRRSQVV